MKSIPEQEVRRKVELENPWWQTSGGIDEFYRTMKPRAYLSPFIEVMDQDVRRAVVLMGPRRVGKTVMLHHAIQELIGRGVPASRICYISIDAPVYIGVSLERLAGIFMEIHGHESLAGCYVFFDEIQYLKGWEVHLKRLVDDYKTTKFIASGSAAAALKLKSQESGAGRFTDFMLPPLTFYEYIEFTDKRHLVSVDDNGECRAADIATLNWEFIRYLNVGGYPEALFSQAIQADPQRYIRSDIIDKVLLRDLPSLYGIKDVQELYRLFSVLAYNTGNEVSLGALSQESGVTKNTIKKYLEYLEAAFLIAILHRVDQHGKSFRREHYFKVYLTNPSIRTALFGPMEADSDVMGHMAETALMAQYVHSPWVLGHLCYARWAKGEVDFVAISGEEVLWCTEVKWSNRFFERPSDLHALIDFASQHRRKNGPIVTTLDKEGMKTVNSIQIRYRETSVHCYLVGRNITKHIGDHMKRTVAT